LFKSLQKADPSPLLRMTISYRHQPKHGGAFSLCHSEELRDEESAFVFD